MLISNAYANAAVAPTPGIIDFLPLVALAVAFYFLAVRPQMKRAKEHKALMEALQRGDEVVTQGGAVGRVTNVYEQYVRVELAENLEVMLQKAAVINLLPKGTLKSIK